MTQPVPVLTYDEAESVGEALHDHLLRLTGMCPFPKGDLGLADTVQYITHRARELAEARDRSET